jgi:hypothetical protein
LSPQYRQAWIELVSASKEYLKLPAEPEETKSKEQSIEKKTEIVKQNKKVSVIAFVETFFGPNRD